MNPIIVSNFDLTLEHNFNKQVEIWVDNFRGVENSNSAVKIFAQIEPNEIMQLNHEMISKSHLFDYILTYENEVLNNIKNAVLFEYGTKWINIDRYEFKEKDFSISTICGHKTITYNHVLRQKIWYKQNQIKTPKRFFLSRLGGVENVKNNPVLGEFKEPLFDSMFHLCIENVSKENLFTEKLTEILKSEGTLRMSVPDLYKVSELHYTKKYPLKKLMGFLYGGQNYNENFHYIGFDFDTLKEDLEILGYKNIKLWSWKEVEHGMVDDYSQAYLPHMDKENGHLMSLNVEATKI